MLMQAAQDFKLSGQSSKGPGMAQFVALASVIVFLSEAAPRFASHEEGMESKEQPFEAGAAKGNTKITLSRSGSTIVADVEMSIDVTGPDGVVLHETAKGVLQIQICPDVQGRVPVKISLTMSSSGSGGGKAAGMQFEMNGRADVLVNDDANIDGYDLDITTGFGAQAQDGSQVSGQFAEVQTNLTFQNINGPGGSQVSGTGSQATRGSSTANAELYQVASKLGTDMALLLVIFLSGEAEKIWQNGYCVEIVIEGADDYNTVDRSSTTPFTGKVRHKFDGDDLNVPITAVLSGEKTLSPTAKTKAPVKYTYTAPGEEKKLATINLETRSKRGADTQTVQFYTGSPGWKLEQDIPVDGGTLTFKGLSCSGVDGPWEITYETDRPGDGFKITGKLEGLFQPDGKASLDHSVHIGYYGVDAGADASGEVEATLRGAGDQYVIELSGGALGGTVWTPKERGSVNADPSYTIELNVTPADSSECPTK